MEEYEKIMGICRDALEKEGYEVSDYSECYMKFTVDTHYGSVCVDFEEID